MQMVVKLLLLVFLGILLASCVSPGEKENVSAKNGHVVHVCNEAVARQSGLAAHLHKKKYEVNYAALHNCKYDYAEINEAYHEGYLKGKDLKESIK